MRSPEPPDDLAAAVNLPRFGNAEMVFFGLDGGSDVGEDRLSSLSQDLDRADVHDGLDGSKPDCRTEVPGELGVVL
jgi:hypothetical protein